jgi:hypothetical protein
MRIRFEAFTAEKNDEMLDTNFSDTISLWSSFEKCPEGAIIERHGQRFNERRDHRRRQGRIPQIGFQGHARGLVPVAGAEGIADGRSDRDLAQVAQAVPARQLIGSGGTGKGGLVPPFSIPAVKTIHEGCLHRR